MVNLRLISERMTLGLVIRTTSFYRLRGSFKEAEKQHSPWWGIGHSKPYALRHLSLNQVCLPIPPIPHIVVPFTLTVSLKSGWGFRHRTETEGVKVPFATITTIPNIQTALFIQPIAVGTVYEDYTFFRRRTWRLQVHALSASYQM